MAMSHCKYFEGSRVKDTPRSSSHVLAIKHTSLNIKSGEYQNSLTEMLASQEDVNTTLLLQDEDALALIDIVDQVSMQQMGIGLPI